VNAFVHPSDIGFCEQRARVKKNSGGKKNTAGRDWLLFNQAGFVTAKQK
jgi:hypothetical protein